MLKRAVLESKNVGISLKKQRFLKLIRVFVGIKTVYCLDYQRLLCNVKNKHFCHLRTTHRQISVVCMLKTAFLSNLFTASGSTRKRLVTDWSKHVIMKREMSVVLFGESIFNYYFCMAMTYVCKNPT